MAKQRVFFDKQEVVLQYNDGKFMTDKVVFADKIASVTFFEEKKGLFGKTVQTITIRAAGIPKLEYSSTRAKQFFPIYLEGFRKFCAANKVTLYDNLTKDEA